MRKKILPMILSLLMVAMMMVNVGPTFGFEFKSPVHPSSTSRTEVHAVSGATTKPIGIPNGVTATSTTNSVTVSWWTVSGATDYDVSFNGSIINTTVASVTFNNLDPDTAYDYSVRANNATESSAYSETQTIKTQKVPPAVPTNISATSTSDSVTISWSPVNNATSYDVSVNGVVRNTANTAIIFDNLAPDTAYTYAVRAVNTTVYSAYSGQQSIQTKIAAPDIPDVPDDVSATATADSVTITWSAVTGATSYSINVNGEVKSTTNTSITFENLAPDSNYDYAVRAINANVSSAYSDVQTIRTQVATADTDVSLSLVIQVLDQNNQAISGADIQVGSYSSETNADGKSELLTLSPGQYKLSITASGYEDYELPLDLLDNTTMTITLETLNGPVNESKHVFSDLNENHWAYGVINALVDKAIVSGYPDGTFQPNKTLSKAEFITLLIKSGSYAIESHDVQYWAYPYLKLALEMQWIDDDHITEGSIYDQAITREEAGYIASLFHAGSSTQVVNSLVDDEKFKTEILDYQTIDGELVSYLAYAFDHGIIAGYPDGTLQPKKILTRAEGVVIVNRLQNQ